MRFLCLHGRGTNSDIFDAQTASLRYELGDGHTYDFVEGNVPYEIAADIKSVVSADEQYFAYFDDASAPSCMRALADLDAYIAAEGPFDGVLAFSQGASLAVTYLLHKQADDPQKFQLEPPFKCGVFVAGLQPVDHTALQRGEVQFLDCNANAEILEMPTANIWGVNDESWGPSSAELNKIGSQRLKSTFVHSGGHEVPGLSSKEAFLGMVECVRATIEKALSAQ